jgi:hypothetical protein
MSAAENSSSREMSGWNARVLGENEKVYERNIERPGIMLNMRKCMRTNMGTNENTRVLKS